MGKEHSGYFLPYSHFTYFKFKAVHYSGMPVMFVVYIFELDFKPTIAI
jgi:hypothetical protein